MRKIPLGSVIFRATEKEMKDSLWFPCDQKFQVRLPDGVPRVGLDHFCQCSGHLLSVAGKAEMGATGSQLQGYSPEVESGQVEEDLCCRMLSGSRYRASGVAVSVERVFVTTE